MLLIRAVQLIFVLFLVVKITTSKVPFLLNNSQYNGLCENFYDFSCKNWLEKNQKPSYEPVWNQFVAVNYQIKRQIFDILQVKTKNQSVKKAQKFFWTCMKTNDKLELKYLKQLKLLIKQWPINDNYEWFNDLKTLSELGIYPIFKLKVDLDYLNTSRNILYIEPGNLIFPQYILQNPLKYKTELQQYKKWISQTANHLNTGKISEKQVHEIIQFEIELSKLQSDISRNFHTTIAELNAKFSFFTEILWEFNGNLNVVLKNLRFFQKLSVFLNETDPSIIGNYLKWVLIKDLSRDTTKFMRNLNFEIDKEILGIQTDLPRKIECLDKILQYFNYALLPSFVKFNKFLDEQKIQEIFTNIRQEFIYLIKDNNWLKSETKQLFIEKVQLIKLFVGFPSSLQKKKDIDQYYNKLEITENHLRNTIRLKYFQRKKDISFKTIWPCNPFDVNAYYSILQNSIYLPLGILQRPFYHNNNSLFANYGSLGTLIGHELSHSLDNLGVQANKYGQVQKWISDNDLNLFQRKTECFRNENVDILTMGETIADNVGLQISLKAYEKNGGLDRELLGLNGNEVKELFFVKFAQNWCEIVEKSDLFVNDEHSTSFKRVNNSLVNSEDFSEIFLCKFNANKCVLW